MFQIVLKNCKIEGHAFSHYPFLTKLIIRGRLRDNESIFPFFFKIRYRGGTPQIFFRTLDAVDKKSAYICVLQHYILNYALLQQIFYIFFICNKNFRVALRLVDLNKDGYKVQCINNVLVLRLGLSHDLKIKFNSNIEAQSVRISRKQKAFSMSMQNPLHCLQFIEFLRKIRKPEPYKGKGVLLKNEVVKRKRVRRAKSSKNFKKRRKVKAKKAVALTFESLFNKNKKRKRSLILDKVNFI